jgi:O-antigen/teichoic acid export membrane protein
MSLFRSGTILFAASMIGNLSNYFFQFFMSRYLSIEDYGAMNAVFSLMIIAGIPTGTIMLVVAKYVSIFKAKDRDREIAYFYKNSLMKMTILGVLFLIPFLIFNNFITNYLKIDSRWPVAIIGIGLFSSFVVTVNMGMLQGLQRFYYMGAGIGLGGVSRLILGMILIFLGLKLNGAVIATAFPGLLIFLITAIPLYNYLKGKVEAERFTKEILSYSLPVLLSSIAFSIITNVDLIIVKHFFPPEDAGLYAAVAILGKTILYLPAAFVLVLFPMVSESHALNNNIYKILDKGLLYTLAFSAIGVVVFLIFPELSIRILFGERFISAAPLLKFYGLAMMFMALISVLMNFNLARQKTGFIYTLGIGCAALITMINLFHDSLLTVILIILSVNLVLSVVNILMVYQDRRVFYQFRKTEGIAGK